MHHPTERCRSLANFSKPWSCLALSRILKISILMYDSVLHNDTGVNRKVPQPQSATCLPPPEGGGLRSGAVKRGSVRLPALCPVVRRPFWEKGVCEPNGVCSRLWSSPVLDFWENLCETFIGVWPLYWCWLEF